MPESIQKKLERVRPARVSITYDVELGDAIEMKELPFVMGVLGDFSGQPTTPLPKLKDRQFVEVTPDNFDDVLKRMQPHLNLTVENRLTDEGGNLAVDLEFESLDDFSPERVAEQVDPLKKLLDLRQQLADLRGTLQGNEKFEEILQATFADDERMKQLQDELGSPDEEEATDGDDEG